MITFSLRLPIGGSLALRGVAGPVSIVDSRSQASLSFDLDPGRSLPERRLSIPLVNGLPSQMVLAGVYFDFQMYASMNFSAGARVVSSDGVRNSDRTRVQAPNFKRKENVGVQMDLKSTTPAPSVWLGWTVSKVGDNTVKIIGDGKILKQREFKAEKIPDDVLKDPGALSQLRFAVHTDASIRNSTRIIVGDIVSFGFMLDELMGKRDIRVEA